MYVIDVDGSGPVEPTYVSCQMGIGAEGDYYGQTVVEHNLRNQTQVRGTMLPDMRIRLTYRCVGEKIVHLFDDVCLGIFMVLIVCACGGGGRYWYGGGMFL